MRPKLASMFLKYCSALVRYMTGKEKGMGTSGNASNGIGHFISVNTYTLSLPKMNQPTDQPTDADRKRKDLPVPVLNRY